MSLLLRFPKGLYGVTPEWDDTDKLLAAIRAAAAGGMAALQWRRKTATAQEGLAQVRQVAALCRELGLTCIVNDDWRLAALIDADGVHLGREDGSMAQARLALGRSEERSVGKEGGSRCRFGWAPHHKKQTRLYNHIEIT